MSQVSKAKAIFLYIVVSAFLAFEMGVQVSPSVMTSQLMHDLKIGTFGLGIMSGIYFYTYTAMQIPSGILFDRFKPRYILTFAILICALGTLLFAFSTNIYLSSIARLLMGIGSAFAFIAVLIVTADLFQHKYFALMTGITQMLAALGAMMGQIPLSKAVLVFGWHRSMFYLAAIGFILAMLTWIFLNYEKEKVISTQQDYFWKNLKKIFANKQTWFIALYACLLWAPMSGFASLWGIPYLMTVHHLTHTQAASLSAMMWLGLALFSPLLGWFSTTVHHRVFPLAASALLGFICFAMLLLITHLSTWMIGALIFLAGGACAGQALSFTSIKENNGEHLRGAAIAVNNMAVVISGAIFQPLIGKILQIFHSHPRFIHSLTLYSARSFKYGLMTILICYALGTLIATFAIKESFSKL